MDEVELAEKNKKVFQEKLLREQEDLLEANIENSREQSRLEGIETQKRLSIEAGIQEEDLIQEQEVLQSIAQQQIQEQIEEDQRMSEGQELQANQEAEQESEGTDGPAGSTMPSFPLIGFMIAVTKDLFDIILTFTGVGILIVGLYTVIYDALAFTWALKRLEKIKAKKDAKSKFKSRLIRRMVSMIAISLVPVLDMLPEASVTVWRNYKAEIALAKGKSV